MMSVIITLLALPIGLFMIIKERRDHQHYQAVFDDFLELIQASNLQTSQKLAKLRAMLEHNYYHILSVDTQEIRAERKLFSMGWLIFSLGFFYIGAVIYMIYFYKFQKPHRVYFCIE